jgi:hypothetical protein
MTDNPTGEGLLDETLTSAQGDRGWQSRTHFPMTWSS